MVDDFGVEYIGKQHAHHLANILKEHHEISQEREGACFASINLQWNYASKHRGWTCRMSIKYYISHLLLKLRHPIQKKP